MRGEQEGTRKSDGDHMWREREDAIDDRKSGSESVYRSQWDVRRKRLYERMC